MTRYTVDFASGEVTETTEERAADGLVADFSGTDRPAEGTPAGLEEFMNRIAAGDAGELPENVREDAELHEALRAQSHEEHFGEEAADGLSDEEMWAEYRKTLGEDA